MGKVLDPCIRALKLGATSRRLVRTTQAGGLRYYLGAMLVSGTMAPAQEALRDSLAGDAAADAHARQQMEMPYTFKTGDFHLLLAPSLELDWSDNVNLVSSGPQEDFILRPMLTLGASYPLTSPNVLRLDTTVGYDAYLQHSEYSGPRILSGSMLSFDTYVKDFAINVHDRFQYTQDSAGEAAVAATGSYGGLVNFAGASVTWDLEDVVTSLGYDHENFVASNSGFDYLNRASDLLVSRAGFRFHPAFTAGVEGTGSFNRYDQTELLNNSTGYSAGLYGDWHPGHYSDVQLRGGYTEYFFEQNSLAVPAANEGAWYLGLTASHDITEAISYSLSAGHEVRLGIEANSVEAWYVRPNINWKLLKDLTFSTSAGYEHGNQTLVSQPPSTENYDWLWFGLGVNYGPTKKLMLSLTYRLTERWSNLGSRDYAQNVVGLRLTYQLQ